jgi:hypothetical protein
MMLIRAQSITVFVEWTVVPFPSLFLWWKSFFPSTNTHKPVSLLLYSSLYLFQSEYNYLASPRYISCYFCFLALNQPLTSQSIFRVRHDWTSIFAILISNISLFTFDRHIRLTCHHMNVAIAEKNKASKRIEGVPFWCQGLYQGTHFGNTLILAFICSWCNLVLWGKWLEWRDCRRNMVDEKNVLLITYLKPLLRLPLGCHKRTS